MNPAFDPYDPYGVGYGQGNPSGGYGQGYPYGGYGQGYDPYGGYGQGYGGYDPYGGYGAYDPYGGYGGYGGYGQGYGGYDPYGGYGGYDPYSGYGGYGGYDPYGGYGGYDPYGGYGQGFDPYAEFAGGAQPTVLQPAVQQPWQLTPRQIIPRVLAPRVVIPRRIWPWSVRVYGPARFPQPMDYPGEFTGPQAVLGGGGIETQGYEAYAATPELQVLTPGVLQPAVQQPWQVSPRTIILPYQRPNPWWFIPRIIYPRVINVRVFAPPRFPQPQAYPGEFTGPQAMLGGGIETQGYEAYGATPELQVLQPAVLTPLVQQPWQLSPRDIILPYQRVTPRVISPWVISPRNIVPRNIVPRNIVPRNVVPARFPQPMDYPVDFTGPQAMLGGGIETQGYEAYGATPELQVLQPWQLSPRAIILPYQRITPWVISPRSIIPRFYGPARFPQPQAYPGEFTGPVTIAGGGGIGLQGGYDVYSDPYQMGGEALFTPQNLIPAPRVRVLPLIRNPLWSTRPLYFWPVDFPPEAFAGEVGYF